MVVAVVMVGPVFAEEFPDSTGSFVKFFAKGRSRIMMVMAVFTDAVPAFVKSNCPKEQHEHRQRDGTN
jgi:hypothetical protein